MSTIQELEQAANKVKNETVQGNNNASRIGELFYNIVEYIKGIPTASVEWLTNNISSALGGLLESLNNLSNPGGELEDDKILVYKKTTRNWTYENKPSSEGGGGGGGGVQTLSSVVMRFRNWNTLNSDNCGPVRVGKYADEEGVIYKDLILYTCNDQPDYYYLNLDQDKPVTEVFAGGAPCDNNGNVNVAAGWVRLNQMSDMAFNTMIAKYGFIENLTARELVITDDGDKPVAGMTRDTAVAGDGGESIGTRGSVRIWAGYNNTTKNLFDSNFFVTESGALHTKLFYAATKKLKDDEMPSYNIDILNDPYYTYVAEPTTSHYCNIYLPAANTCEGIELRFYSIYTGMRSGKTYIKVKQNTEDRIHYDNGGTAVNDDAVVLMPNQIVTFKNISNSWYVITGEIFIEQASPSLEE